MSGVTQEQQGAPPPDEVTFDDVVEFFKAINASDKCPSCGREHWHIGLNADGTQQYPIVAFSPSMDGLPQKVIAIVVLICGTCGFIRSHARKTIREWILLGKPVENDDKPKGDV